ncbi:uncharacterized protein LOC129297532 isoform X1 [Prosopis cineraria]|uniref:uncharacterized protein LOC129297532 isoform X1 n=1 Tax=Prosopis cineraria TaxID=364024 RepID=UPI00240FF640|nr:uncharacterized protein LOC129297532 isoform X1 [Prosopis cineraria]
MHMFKARQQIPFNGYVITGLLLRMVDSCVFTSVHGMSCLSLPSGIAYKVSSPVAISGYAIYTLTFMIYPRACYAYLLNAFYKRIESIGPPFRVVLVRDYWSEELCDLTSMLNFHLYHEHTGFGFFYWILMSKMMFVLLLKLKFRYSVVSGITLCWLEVGSTLSLFSIIIFDPGITEGVQHPHLIILVVPSAHFYMLLVIWALTKLSNMIPWMFHAPSNFYMLTELRAVSIPHDVSSNKICHLHTPYTCVGHYDWIIVNTNSLGTTKYSQVFDMCLTFNLVDWSSRLICLLEAPSTLPYLCFSFKLEWNTLKDENTNSNLLLQVFKLIILLIGLGKDAEYIYIQFQNFWVYYILISWNGLGPHTRYTLTALKASSLPFDLEGKVNLYGEGNVMNWPNSTCGAQDEHVAWEVVLLYDLVTSN